MADKTQPKKHLYQEIGHKLGRTWQQVKAAAVRLNID
jgi:hypothetical protein